MVDRDPGHGRMHNTTTTPAVRSQNPDPVNVTPWPRSRTSFPRGSRRRSAIAAMSASRRDKTSVKNSNGKSNDKNSVKNSKDKTSAQSRG